MAYELNSSFLRRTLCYFLQKLHSLALRTSQEFNLFRLKHFTNLFSKIKLSVFLSVKIKVLKWEFAHVLCLFLINSVISQPGG